ncbi:Uncharacterised protein [Mycobacteroides abscessus subsp. abscessus]|nr:Uncharacterised protein [Mycobacteroides abscessus subsp. abscessus]SKN65994.1 Uncharacterised protein [Mycobacteroides abscessus subsp. abscessus]
MLALSDHEVGETEESAVEHRGLVDGGIPLLEGPSCGGRGSLQALEGEGGRKRDAGHSGAEPRLESGKVVGFVRVTQDRGARQQFIIARGCRSPTELGIEHPQQGVFTARGRG